MSVNHLNSNWFKLDNLKTRPNMVKPNDEYEQLQSMDFNSNHTIAVFLGTSIYNTVFRDIGTEREA